MLEDEIIKAQASGWWLWHKHMTWVRNQNQWGSLHSGPSQGTWGLCTEAVGVARQGCNELRLLFESCGGRWHSPALFFLHPPPSRPDLGVRRGGITIQPDKWRCGWPWNSPLRHRNCYSPSAAAISFPSPLREFGVLFFLSTTTYIYVTAREPWHQGSCKLFRLKRVSRVDTG